MSRRRKKQVTLIDLGKRLNLTPRAVSQALNSGDCTVRISEKTRARVLALAKKLNYRPNRLAQILRKGTSGMAGVVAVQQFGYLIQQELFYARLWAEENGLIPSIYLMPDRSVVSQQRAVDFVLDTKVDGLVVIGDIFQAPQLKRIEEYQVPAVSVGSPIVPLIPRYYSDKKSGFALLARHLISQGASRITLLLTHPEPSRRKYWHSWCAQEGTREAVDEARKEGRNVALTIQPVPNPSAAENAAGVNLYYLSGYTGMKSVVASGAIPDALMCQADNVVQGALLACAEHGIRVPQDMMITGFEDDAASSAGLLPVTSVGQPVAEMLRLAFADMKAISLGQRKQASRSVMLPCALRIRQSTQRSA